MVELEVVEKLIAIASGIATVLVVYLLWKTVRHMEESARLSKIEVVHRFRPWVGPSSGIEFNGNAQQGKQQFVIKLKNYGELPASSVTAKFIMKEQMPTRDVLKAEGVDSLNLGPLLPNMEKRYWFFIDSETIEKAKSNNAQVFVVLYFEYVFPQGRSGYGMISQFDSNANIFVHKDMWVD